MFKNKSLFYKISHGKSYCKWIDLMNKRHKSHWRDTSQHHQQLLYWFPENKNCSKYKHQEDYSNEHRLGIQLAIPQHEMAQKFLKNFHWIPKFMQFKYVSHMGSINTYKTRGSIDDDLTRSGGTGGWHRGL